MPAFGFAAGFLGAVVTFLATGFAGAFVEPVLVAGFLAEALVAAGFLDGAFTAVGFFATGLGAAFLAAGFAAGFLTADLAVAGLFCRRLFRSSCFLGFGLQGCGSLLGGSGLAACGF